MIAVQFLFAVNLAIATPLLIGVAWYCEREFRRQTALKNFHAMTDDEIATVILSDHRRSVFQD
ncbi:hypothetical protein [Ensifer adhaerens]|jgi:hypothetical protein|uniref:hypothetical protein n=1 Tax=Ensifer adhaerens TaxID=106592 RepID=UPI00202EF60B|nr:hypothetical protein [Ensifer adhaerens]